MALMRGVCTDQCLNCACLLDLAGEKSGVGAISFFFYLFIFFIYLFILVGAISCARNSKFAVILTLTIMSRHQSLIVSDLLNLVGELCQMVAFSFLHGQGSWF